MIVKPRTKIELNYIRESGKISAAALKVGIEKAKPGVNLLEIEKAVWEEIKRLGGGVSFITVAGYKWATCLTINEELVHGIPRDIVLKEGDVLSIDTGAIYKGWHTDTAWSIVVGGQGLEDGNEKSQFLSVGEEAMWKGIKQAVAGNFIGDISNAIQTTIEAGGYDVSRELIGHGVGREVHEPPDVPGYGKPGMGLQLMEGMTLAIEAIYAQNKADVELAADGWTYVTKDKSLGGLFEMSIIVLDGKTEVLTDWRKI